MIPQHQTGAPTDSVAALSFLRALYEQCTEGAVVLVRAPGFEGHRFALGNLASAANAACAWALSADVYTTVATMRPVARGRGTQEDVIELPALFADLDRIAPGHGAADADLAPDLDAALALVDRFGLPASMVVDSGGGIHPYVLLDRPLTADAIPQVLAAWRQAWQAIASACPWSKAVDVGVAGNAACVLRIPGTINRKVPDNLRPVRLIEMHPDRRYTIEQVMAAARAVMEAAIDRDIGEQDARSAADGRAPAEEVAPRGPRAIVPGDNIHSLYPGLMDECIERVRAHGLVVGRERWRAKPEGEFLSIRCPLPEHPDDHPSAWINRTLGVWGCGSCGARGGLLELAGLVGVPDVATYKVKAAGRALLSGPPPPRHNGARGSAADSRTRGRILRASDVVPTRVEWLWAGRIPLGKLSLGDGDPGVGKSLAMLDVSARVTRGLPMPDGGRADLDGARGVLVLSAEDDPADTIRPRLDAAGADVGRVVMLTDVVDATGADRMPELTTDLGLLREIVEDESVALVIIDVLMSYLPGDVNAHRDQDVRRALAPLARLAMDTHAAVVALRHFNKRVGLPSIYRGGGSIGISGQARSVLLFARDPDAAEDQARGILARGKCNLAAPVPSLSYMIETAANGAARVAWGGESAHTAESLLGMPADAGERSALDDACALLDDLLAGGPVSVSAVKTEATVAGISWRTIERAKARIGVDVRREGEPGQRGGGRWVWSLPAGIGANNTAIRSIGGVGGLNVANPVNAPSSSPDLTRGGGVNPVPPGAKVQPESWTCACGKVSTTETCWNCRSPRPVGSGNGHVTGIWSCPCGTAVIDELVRCPKCGARRPADPGMGSPAVALLDVGVVIAPSGDGAGGES